MMARVHAGIVAKGEATQEGYSSEQVDLIGVIGYEMLRYTSYAPLMLKSMQLSLEVVNSL